MSKSNKIQSEHEILVSLLDTEEHLRSRDDLRLLYKFVERVKFFKDIIATYGHDSMLTLCRKLKSQHFTYGQVIVKSGDSGREFFIILSGKVGIWIVMPSDTDPDIHQLKELKTLGAHDSFGEMALLGDNNVRTATIIAKSDTIVAILTKDEFLDSVGAKYTEQVNNKIEFLKKLEFLANWNIRQIKTLSYQFQNLHLNLNQEVYDDKSKCSYVYFIQEGEFKLSKSNVVLDEFTELLVKTEFDICIFSQNEVFGLEAIYKYPNYIGKVRCVTSSGLLYRILVKDLYLRLADDFSKSYIKNIARQQVDYVQERVLHLSVKKDEQIYQKSVKMQLKPQMMTRSINQAKVSSYRHVLSVSALQVAEKPVNDKVFQLQHTEIQQEERQSKYSKRNFVHLINRSQSLGNAFNKKQIVMQNHVDTENLNKTQIQIKKPFTNLIRSRNSDSVDYNILQFDLRERHTKHNEQEVLYHSEQLSKDTYKFRSTDLSKVNRIIKTILSGRTEHVLSSASVEKSRLFYDEKLKEMKIILRRKDAKYRIHNSSSMGRSVADTSTRYRTQQSTRKNSSNQNTLRHSTSQHEIYQQSYAGISISQIQASDKKERLYTNYKCDNMLSSIKPINGFVRSSQITKRAQFQNGNLQARMREADLIKKFGNYITPD